MIEEGNLEHVIENTNYDIFLLGIHVLLSFLCLVNISLLYSTIIISVLEKMYLYSYFRNFEFNRKNKSLGNQNMCNFMIQSSQTQIN